LDKYGPRKKFSFTGFLRRKGRQIAGGLIEERVVQGANGEEAGSKVRIHSRISRSMDKLLGPPLIEMLRGLKRELANEPV
jgi:hypothetical protein